MAEIADQAPSLASPWAPTDGGECPGDSTVYSTTVNRRQRPSSPTDELEAIFGSPGATRPLRQESISHRRRGLASAAGGGETLDRRRKGSTDDVLVTLLAHPTIVATLAVEGTALLSSQRLLVDVKAHCPERHSLAFDAMLRTFLWVRCPARLRLYGSASMNVTVLVLTPAVARRRPSRWFVRSGNKAMERIIEHLAAEVEQLRWHPPNKRMGKLAAIATPLPINGDNPR